MSNTDVEPTTDPEQVQAQKDSPPLFPNNPATPFAPGGSDLASVARQRPAMRLPQPNRAQGMNLAYAGDAAPGAPGWTPRTGPWFDDQGNLTNQPAQPQAPAPPPAPTPPAEPQNFIMYPPSLSNLGKLPAYNEGTDGAEANIPTPMQGYKVAGMTANDVSLYGPPEAAQGAARAFNLLTPIQFLLDAISGGRFTANFSMSRLAALKATQMQWMMEHEKWTWNLGQNLMRYNELLALRQDNAINDEQLEQRLRVMAVGDEPLQIELNNKGLAGALALIARRQAWYQNGVAGGRSVRNANPDIAAEEALDPDAKVGGLGMGGYGGLKLPEKPGYGPLPGHEGVETPAAPANEAPPKSETDENILDEAIAKLYPNPYTGKPMSADEQGVMHDVYNGYPSKAYDDLPKKGTGLRKTRERIDAGVQKLDYAVNQVEKDDKLSREEKLDKIGKIDKTHASNLGALVSYDAEAKDLTPDRKQQANLEAEARLLDHTYKPSTFKIVQKYRDPNTKEGVILRRATSLPTAVLKLDYALKPLSETDKIPSNQIGLFAAEHWTGDPKYADLHTAIRQVATEAVAIEMGTGTPRVSQINEQVKYMTASGSPAQIRVQAQTLLRNAYVAVKQINQQFKEEVNDPARNAPGIFQSSLELTDGLLRVTPTGRVPSDAPDVLKGADKPKGPRPSWMKPGEDREPITRKDIDKAKEFIKKYENDPDPDVQREIQKYRERIGLDW
jgi:hypothetical protein